MGLEAGSQGRSCFARQLGLRELTPPRRALYEIFEDVPLGRGLERGAKVLGDRGIWFLTSDADAVLRVLPGCCGDS